jgi:hypothetical protein
VLSAYSVPVLLWYFWQHWGLKVGPQAC